MIIHTKTTLKNYNLDIEVEISEKKVSGLLRMKFVQTLLMIKKKSLTFQTLLND